MAFLAVEGPGWRTPLGLGGADDDECERSEHEEEEVPREVRRIAGNSGVGNHFAPVSRLKYAHQA